MGLWEDVAPLIERDPVYGCDLYTGATNGSGYGIVWRSRRSILLHRALYEERHGPIPQGMEVEHVCRRRTCLRDIHHELLTRGQQERAKHWRSRVIRDARRRVCDHGHVLAINCAVTPEGGRTCRACNRSGEP